MEAHDIELVRETVRAAVRGTPVSVYDNAGDLCSFKLEDVINITQAPNDKRIVYIALSNDAICTKENGEIRHYNPIVVTGTLNKWHNILGFNYKVLNDED